MDSCLPNCKGLGLYHEIGWNVSFSYHVLYNAFKRLSRAYSPSERAAMFHDTAVKVYRIGVEPLRGG